MAPLDLDDGVFVVLLRKARTSFEFRVLFTLLRMPSVTSKLCIVVLCSLKNDD